MSRHVFVPIALALPVAALVGCGLTGGRDSKPIEGQSASCVRQKGTLNNGPLPAGCVKTEGSELGRAGARFEVGDSEVTIDRWLSKSDSGEGEYVGFTYTVTGDVFISVKAGRESYVSDDTGTWVHPNGTSGPTASAISNIVLCPGDPPVPPASPDPGAPGRPDPGAPGRPDPGAPGSPDPGAPGSPDPGGPGGGGDEDPCGSPDPGVGEPDPGVDPNGPEGGSDGEGVPDGQDPTPNGGPDPGGSGTTPPGGTCTVNSDCVVGAFCSAGVCTRL